MARKNPRARSDLVTRPTEDPEIVLRAILRFRLREDEREIVRRAAKAARKNPSVWLREIVMAAARKKLGLSDEDE